MKKNFLFLSVVLMLAGCADLDELATDKGQQVYEEADTSARLNFEDEFSLEKAIEAGQLPTTRASVRSGASGKFISMLDLMTSTRGTEEELTYYEALGYDTLVPNPNFARLLNHIGELEVGKEVIRITPNGTYKYPIGYEEAFNAFIESNPDYIGEHIEEDLYKINDQILLYRTFEENEEDYEVISEGNYEELPDDFFGDDNEEEIFSRAVTRAASEPNFDSFDTFSADKKTVVGKLIQNIIGSTKSHTVKFNSKRRVKGSFYFYNYGVYGEIGVKGWTDKKNWIGWSKTKADELRVGWNHVILKLSIPDYYKESMKNMNSMAYYAPQYLEVNGKKVNVATLAMPEFKPDFKDKVFATGAKAIQNYLKSELKRPQREWEKAQAFIVATRTELYFVASPEDVKKMDAKSYTHVFAQNWMTFMISWNNKDGFFINGMNQNNIKDIGAWGNAVFKTFNEKKKTLVGGEVYICARFGNEWRGMKIKKKDKK